MTREIHSTLDYPLTRRWAAALRAARFDGLRYLARHDPGTVAHAIALFGPEGERRSGGWLRGTARRIEADLLERIQQETGIHVADPPAARQLRIT